MASLRPYVLEEAYEVAGRSTRGHGPSIAKSWGTCSFKSCSRRGSPREGHFDFSDVVDSISEKLIRRHPHIFSDVEADTPEKGPQELGVH